MLASAGSTVTAGRPRAEVIAIMESSDVLAAAAAYRAAFGHNVPTQVLRLFAPRPGPLVLEIRQALALGRPVPGWSALARAAEINTGPNWPPGS